jgi:hypothetical protein
MRSDALAAMRDLHRRRCGAKLDALTDQRMGNAVITVVEDDVVVDVDARPRQLRRLEAAGRERFELRPVDALERGLAASGDSLEGTTIELFEQLGDGEVELIERKEAVTKAREDPPLRDQPRRLRLWPCPEAYRAAPE